MIDRRSLIKMLAGIPVLGFLIPSSPVSDASGGAGEPNISKGKWFAYGFEGDVEFFDSRDAAIKWAQESIEYACDETWDEGVSRICVGCVTDQATETDVVTRDMLDENNCYQGMCHDHVAGLEWERSCNYEMLPVE